MFLVVIISKYLAYRVLFSISLAVFTCFFKKIGEGRRAGACRAFVYENKCVLQPSKEPQIPTITILKAIFSILCKYKDKPVIVNSKIEESHCSDFLSHFMPFPHSQLQKPQQCFNKPISPHIGPSFVVVL